MPELFGVVADRPLSVDEISCFESLAQEFQDFRPGQISRLETTFARVGVMSRHPMDHAEIRAIGSSPSKVCWAGTSPLRRGCQFEEVAMSITTGSGKFLESLEPRWNCIVVSDDNRQCWLASDRHGHCPLFYSNHGVLAFSSKFLPLLRSGLCSWELDPEGIIDLVTFEHLTADRTLAKGVRLLNPATIITRTADELKEKSYWRPEFRQVNRTEPSYTSWYKALCDSTKTALKGADQVAVTLSGGLDSRAVLHCVRASGVPAKTYTFGLPACRDMYSAHLLSERCGFPHFKVEADGHHIDQWLKHTISVTGGMVGAMHFQILSLVDAMTSQNETMILDGLGGDAWTGSYLRPQSFMGKSNSATIDFVLGLRSTGWKSLSSILESDFLESTDYRPRDAIAAHFDDQSGLPPWVGCQSYYILENQRRFAQSGPLLVEPMIGVRTPFYDFGVVNVALGFGPKDLLEQRVHLLMHARHMKDLAGVPDALRGISLRHPSWVRFLKKAYDAGVRRSPRAVRRVLGGNIEPMTCYAEWFRSRLNNGLASEIRSSCNRLNGVLKHEEVERIINEHSAGLADHSTRIGILLALGGFAAMANGHPCH